MKPKLLHLLSCLVFLLIGTGQVAKAQVTVTISATGTAGSLNTGSVSSTGVKSDGNLTNICDGCNRGFAQFDLTAIPAGSTITSVNVLFTTYSSTLSTATNYVGGTTGDPAAIAGSTLYTTLGTVASATTNFNASSWTASGVQTKAFNATGVSFIASHVGDSCIISFVRGSTNVYNIYGYGGGPSCQPPQLQITYTPSTTCSAPVSGGTTTTSLAAVCASTCFTLSVTGGSAISSGIAFQWQRESAGTWVDITGATGVSYSGTQTATTNYRRRTICTTGPDTAYSSLVTITSNLFSSCYCGPATGETLHSSTVYVSNLVSNVAIPGTALNSAAAAPPITGSATSFGYTQTLAPPASNTADLATGALYAINATVTSATLSAVAWIDFNQDGVYAAGEGTVLTKASSTATTASGYVTVPTGAVLGLTGMRIRASTSGTGVTTSGACTDLAAAFVTGETEDRQITIVAGTACTSTLTGGTAFSSVSSVCSTVNFTLTDTAYSAASGITYQWQRRIPAGTGAWVNIASATLPTLTTSLTATTDYRLRVLCTGTDSAFSNVVTVTQNPFYGCYCGPSLVTALHTTTTDPISRVAIPTTTLNSTAATPPTTGTSTGYTQTFAPPLNNTAELGQGVAYTIYASVSPFASSTVAWIDFDGNGTFAATEGIVLTKTSTFDTLATGTIVVPTGAVPGLTGMRIRSRTTTPAITTAGACTSFSLAETEDRLVTILTTAACSGLAGAGTIAGPSLACPSVPFLLTDTTYAGGVSGLTFQWQSAPAGSTTFTNATGTGNTTPTLTASQTVATDYRLKIRCATGPDSAFTPVFTVNMNVGTACYCTPTYGTTGCNFGYTIDTFILNGAGGASINQNNTNCTGTGYINYATLPALTLAQNTTYTGFISTDYTSAFSTRAYRIWIDFGNDGVFGPTDTVSTFSASTITPANLPFQIIIPSGAAVGIHRMRVRYNVFTTTAPDPCTDYASGGETHDYRVDIIAPSDCFATGGSPAGTVASTDSAVCTGQSFTLSLPGSSTATGLTYQWQRDSAGVWVNLTGPGSTSPLITLSQTVATTYRAVLECPANPGFGDTAAPLTVIMENFLSCYCASAATSTADEDLTRVAIGTMNNTSACSTLVGSAGTATGTASLYSNFTASVPAPTLVPGCNYTLTTQSSNCGTGTFSNIVRAWIDFNRNGLLTDPGEEFLVQPVTAVAPATPVTTNFSLTIPVTGVSAGTTLMRVSIRETSAAFGPCELATLATTTYGETEDYYVAIAPVPTCLPPTAPTASAISSSGATLSWTAPATAAASYTLEYGPTGFMPGTGTTVSGITGTSYVVSGLAATTAYQFNVRTVCSAADSSTCTATGSFSTIAACSSPTALTAGSITFTGATLSWTPPVGSTVVSYSLEYGPTGFVTGTYVTGITGMSYAVTGLTPATGYQFRVRTRCSATDSSGFSALASFTTPFDCSAGGTIACGVVDTFALAAGTGLIAFQSGFPGPATGCAFGTPGKEAVQKFVAPTTGTYTFQVTAVVSGSGFVDYLFKDSALGTSCVDTSGYICIDDLSGVTATPVSFSLVAGKTYYILADPEGTGGVTHAIRINCPATCAVPTALTASGITTTGATIAWTTPVTGAPGLGYTVYYGPTGFTPGTGGTTLTGVTTTSLALTGLTPGTGYQFYVRGVCSATDSSTLAGPTSFTTVPTCVGPTALTASAVTVTGATVSWTAPATPPASYTVVYGPTGFSPATGGTSVAGLTGTSYTITGLTGGTAYQVYVRAVCSAADSSPLTGPTAFSTLLANDSAPGAMLLTVGAACTGTPYTNVGATQPASEPRFTCTQGTETEATVWFKFVAPASGLVRVSTDFAGGLGDTRLALYSATDSSSYGTFQTLGCDDDNGGGTNKSIIYSPQLTAGQTYYVQVSGYFGGTGSFCLQINEMDSSMLASSGSCFAAATPFSSSSAAYNSWFSIVDAAGDLIVNVRVPAGAPVNSFTSTTVRGTVNTSGTPRYEFGTTGRRYLDRNWSLNSSATITSADVMFPYRSSEGAALSAVAGLPTGSINRQTGTTCEANYNATAGTTSVLTTTLTGFTPTMRYVMATTPGFSNFYLFADTTGAILPASGLTVRATNVEDRNRVEWTNVAEAAGTSYEVQRSVDGRSFATIGLASGTGSGVTYTHWDAQPMVGLNHYRILAATPSGVQTVSRVVTAYVNGTGSFTLQAFPNPMGTEGQLTVRTLGLQTGSATIAVTDLAGKVLRMAVLKDGAVEASFDLSAFASGVYFVRYTDDARTETVKVTKR